MNEQQLRRLSDCEVHISKYHDRINEYLTRCDIYSKQIMSKDEFQKAWEDFNNRMSRDFGMVRKDIVELHKENVDLHGNLRVMNQNAVNQISAHHQMLNKHGEHLERLLTDNENTKVEKDFQRKQLEAFEKRIEDCEKFYNDLQQFKQLVHKLNGSLQEQINQISSRLDGFEAKYQLQASNNAMLQVQIDDLKVQSNDRSKALAQARLDLQSEFKQSLNEFAQVMQIKLDNLPRPVIQEQQPQIDLTPKFEAFKKEMQDTYSTGLLDISNAKTKADVNEIHIKVMDKKLENIYLLLKKHELTL